MVGECDGILTARYSCQFWTRISGSLDLKVAVPAGLSFSAYRFIHCGK